MLSGVPSFLGPKTLPIALLALPAQFTMGVVGVLSCSSEPPLFDLLRYDTSQP